ncbi:MAG TPA: phosphotransferase family protein [Micromonosporaceae bacterium]
MDSSPAAASPPGLDLDRLANYLDAAGIAVIGRPVAAEVIAGGKSNLTYRVDGESGVAVLRRPPLGHVLPTAHDMAREYRIIAALHPTGFPVPAPLHLCSDPEVLGAPFYLMSYVDGVVLRRAEDLARVSPTGAARLSDLLVDTLAQLHTIDPATVGLADFGRPDGFLERQVRRWYEQWTRSKTRELPPLEAVAVNLRDAVPAPARASIVHGDYRLDNVIVDAEVARILAVLDWEMATLGDPLTDVGLLVVYTELAAAGLAPTLPRLGPEQGFAGADDLVRRYAERAAGTVPVERIGWYVALGYFKLAIISEGIHARFLQGKTVGAGFDRMGAAVPLLVDRASDALKSVA